MRLGILLIASLSFSLGVVDAVEINRTKEGKIKEVLAYECFDAEDEIWNQLRSADRLERLVIRSPNGKFPARSEWFENKPNLWHVDLLGCRVTESALQQIFALPSLKNVQLHDVPLSQKAVALTSCRPIVVELSKCALTDRVASTLASKDFFRECEVLSVSGSPLSVETLKLVKMQADSLSELSLYDVNLSDDAIPVIAGMDTLELIKVEKCKLSGNHFGLLAKLNKLETLLASDVKLTAEQCEAFVVHPQLRSFRFDWSEIPFSTRDALAQRREEFLRKSKRSSGGN